MENIFGLAIGISLLTVGIFLSICIIGAKQIIPRFLIKMIIALLVIGSLLVIACYEKAINFHSEQQQIQERMRK